ncbi:alpha/beta-hydrolase [Didymella exigua CBS 183.55]|uniref:Alpha/beta-hydrolase n=1 Tax=Didymella exigua CBS 183.55 TaxID=1150837 RepID=A0A6A5R5J9_9PLEO|nr:alpha/beta-hydrolase [Didymella exigua CBS 183.55]KAF1922893.1 alpha/beta-hydrolase [Didymella exigua CBS 183.55]
MASNPPGECCAKGTKHEGEPKGEFKLVDGIDTYLAHPASGSTKDAIVILTDIFGHKFVNVRLIADSFAERGYFVAVPDLFNGDPAPLDRPAGFNVMEWLKNGHTMKEVDPIVERVISDLKTTHGVERLGGVGYCFGGKYVTRFLKASKIDAGFIAHPSHVSVEEVEAIEGPLSIAAAEIDPIFPVQKRRETEDILLKKDIRWQMNLFSDVEHGFAVKGDLTNSHIRWAKEQAFLQAVQWFDEHVKKH